MLIFSSPAIKGYSAAQRIAEAAAKLTPSKESPIIVLSSSDGRLHSVYCSREWRALCEQTFLLCKEDSWKFNRSWDSILEYLGTQPRYFEPGSGSG